MKPSNTTPYAFLPQPIYGSSMLGVRNAETGYSLQTAGTGVANGILTSHTLGLKQYQLTNHLGNVLSTVSDKKTFTANNFFNPDVVSSTDYYAFGMEIRERSFNQKSEPYRYGFNGKENLDEINGWQDYGARMYNRLICRLPSPDPITKKYPMLSPYQFAANTPIWAKDIDGLEALIMSGGTTTIVANIICVTAGKDKVDVALLQKEVESRIISLLKGVNDEMHATGDNSTLDIKLNFITTDKEGNPLDFKSAVDLAKNNSPEIEYEDMDGAKKVLKDMKTSIVVHSDNDGRLKSNHKKGEYTPNNEVNNIDGVNKIEIDQEDPFDLFSSVGASFIHELGHGLGRNNVSIDGKDVSHPGGSQNTDLGITSLEDRNVYLNKNDVPILRGGAKQNGVPVKGKFVGFR